MFSLSIWFFFSFIWSKLVELSCAQKLKLLVIFFYFYYFICFFLSLLYNNNILLVQSLCFSGSFCFSTTFFHYNDLIGNQIFKKLIFNVKNIVVISFRQFYVALEIYTTKTILIWKIKFMIEESSSPKYYRDPNI